MFTRIITIAALLMSCFTYGAQAQIVKIPDPNFKQALINKGFDLNGDGEIQLSEAQKVTVLYVDNAGITSLEGIKSFSNVEDLGIYQNKTRMVDVSGMTKLKYIYGFDNVIEQLNVKGCVNLLDISCHKNKLKTIDVSGLKKLQVLSIGFNEITRLDVSNLTELVELHAHTNELRELKFDNCPALKDIWIRRNQIAHHMDLTKIPGLRFFRAADNLIPSVDIRGLAELETFDCDNCRLTSINLSGTVKLKELDWY